MCTLHLSHTGISYLRPIAVTFGATMCRSGTQCWMNNIDITHRTCTAQFLPVYSFSPIPQIRILPISPDTVLRDSRCLNCITQFPRQRNHFSYTSSPAYPVTPASTCYLCSHDVQTHNSPEHPGLSCASYRPCLINHIYPNHTSPGDSGVHLRPLMAWFNTLVNSLARFGH